MAKTKRTSENPISVHSSQGIISPNKKNAGMVFQGTLSFKAAFDDEQPVA